MARPTQAANWNYLKLARQYRVISKRSSSRLTRVLTRDELLAEQNPEVSPSISKEAPENNRSLTKALRLPLETTALQKPRTSQNVCKHLRKKSAVTGRPWHVWFEPYVYRARFVNLYEVSKGSIMVWGALTNRFSTCVCLFSYQLRSAAWCRNAPSISPPTQLKPEFVC